MALLLIGGCNSVGTDPDGESGFNTEMETQTIATGAVNTNEIDRGQYGNIVEGTQRVLRSDKEFSAFWADLHADQNSANDGTPPDPPQVDFDTQIVVAVVLGERSTGGYSVDVDQVVANDEEGTMRVDFTETMPGSTCAVSQVFTSPYVLATVDMEEAPPEADDEVLFSRSEQTDSC